MARLSRQKFREAFKSEMASLRSFTDDIYDILKTTLRTYQRLSGYQREIAYLENTSGKKMTPAKAYDTYGLETREHWANVAECTLSRLDTISHQVYRIVDSIEARLVEEYPQCCWDRNIIHAEYRDLADFDLLPRPLKAYLHLKEVCVLLSEYLKDLYKMGTTVNIFIMAIETHETFRKFREHWSYKKPVNWNGLGYWRGVIAKMRGIKLASSKIPQEVKEGIVEEALAVVEEAKSYQLTSALMNRHYEDLQAMKASVDFIAGYLKNRRVDRAKRSLKNLIDFKDQVKATCIEVMAMEGIDLLATLANGRPTPLAT